MTAQAGYARACHTVQAALVALAAVAMLPLAVDLGPTPGLGWFLFTRQDVAMLVPVFAATLARPGRPPAGGGWAAAAASPWLLPATAIALLLACRAGHDIVFFGRDFTRDEQLARFDGFILRDGRLAWPLAPGWRGLVPALNDDFLLPVAGARAWVSNYLPVNAAAQALLGAWASPAFVALGAAALWDAAGRLWPGDAGARAVALACYALSAQIVLTGMTGYAMSGHLALALAWLAAFLRGGWRGHAAAIATGALATGLHQPLFHPLFALPFIAMLAARRDWRTLACYLLGYAAIAGFWLAWPGWASRHAAGGIAAAAGAPVGFADRLAGLVAAIRPLPAAWLTALNLLRFATWQNVALLPLALYGAAAAWRADPVARALAAGVVLPVIVAAVLLPYQGHGWGYRYVHGVIGNAALLAGYGWRAARARGLDLGRAMLWTSLASLLLLPVRAVEARRMAAVPAALDGAIRAGAPRLVVVADDAAPFAADLVINRPDLAPPVLLRRSQLTRGQFRRLCRLVPGLRVVGPAALAPLRALYATPLPPGTPPGPRCP